MSIHFVPNDPLAGAPAPQLRRKKPRPDRRAEGAGFTFHDPEPEGLYQPGTPGFLYWQCREAALSALAAWERDAGKISAWQAGRKIDLWQNAVAQLGARPDLNAYYDRASLQFFEYFDGTKRSFSGASTDVVAHEAGHGLLDAIRPDLWDSPYLEAAAFHEAFGDCVALLTALSDAKTRRALLSAKPEKPNFVEATAEDLSDSIRRVAPAHNAAEPRRALNTLRWQLPSTLPADGGPGELINESHSFARVFTGCFWDLLLRLLGDGAGSTALRKATRTLARLLVAGARTAPDGPRLFQAIGRAMTLADEEANGGANRVAIREAFGAHGIALGSNSLLAPSASLAGAGPTLTASSAALARLTVRDLSARIGAKPAARLEIRPRRLAGEQFAEALHRREVSLTPLGAGLRGVVALAPESVLVGVSGLRAAIVGGLPDRTSTEDEVRTYVSGLLGHGRIQFDRREVARVRGAEVPGWHSHAVKESRGAKVLVRIRFSCGPAAPGRFNRRLPRSGRA
jgi:hypothetical protein